MTEAEDDEKVEKRVQLMLPPFQLNPKRGFSSTHLSVKWREQNNDARQTLNTILKLMSVLFHA